MTGNYAALGRQALPPYVFTDSVKALAQRWLDEWKKGIDSSSERHDLRLPTAPWYQVAWAFRAWRHGG